MIFLYNATIQIPVISIRYGWLFLHLPEMCECGFKFTIDHALSCKKKVILSRSANILRSMTSWLQTQVAKQDRISVQVFSGRWDNSFDLRVFSTIGAPVHQTGPLESHYEHGMRWSAKSLTCR